jgi:hypothetical protein
LTFRQWGFKTFSSSLPLFGMITFVKAANWPPDKNNNRHTLHHQIHSSAGPLGSSHKRDLKGRKATSCLVIPLNRLERLGQVSGVRLSEESGSSSGTRNNTLLDIDQTNIVVL